MNPKVDFYFNKGRWKEEIKLLRTIVLDSGLNEELKWGCPCYMFGENKIVLIHVFKEYFALLFFKGALLHDTNGILIQQTKNVQGARQIRFSSAMEISNITTVVKAYIYEAIEVEKAGLKVLFKKTNEFTISAEFQKKLDRNRLLKTAFHALTPGRQRSYLLHFSQAKQPKTRQARVEKCTPQILKGKGLKD